MSNAWSPRNSYRGGLLKGGSFGVNPLDGNLLGELPYNPHVGIVDGQHQTNVYTTLVSSYVAQPIPKQPIKLPCKRLQHPTYVKDFDWNVHIKMLKKSRQDKHKDQQSEQY